MVPSPHYTASPQHTILLVDDYVDALPAWEIFLRAEGFAVITATTGQEALSAATTDRPDLIVMDLNLPDCSGCDIARTLKAAPATIRLPLIAATGYSQQHRLDEAREAGFDAVIVKPCDPVTLVAEIRRLLGPRPSVP